MTLILVILTSVFVTGCSVVGQSDVDSAPYTLLQSDQIQKIEVRNYDSMVLVSTSMSSESGNSAFRKLFSYITGDNEGATKIAMTTPVIMNDNNQLEQDLESTVKVKVKVKVEREVKKRLRNFHDCTCFYERQCWQRYDVICYAKKFHIIHNT